MKTFFATVALTFALAAPVLAQGGNIAGTESRGTPLNNSVYAPGINPETGKMPGYRPGTRAHAKYYVHKKKRSHVTTSGSSNSMRSGY